MSAKKRKQQVARLIDTYTSAGMNPDNVQLPPSIFKLLTKAQAILLVRASQCCPYVDAEFVLRELCPQKIILHPRYGEVRLFNIVAIIDALAGEAFVANGRKVVGEGQS